MADDPGFDRLSLPGRGRNGSSLQSGRERNGGSSQPPRLSIGRVNPNDHDFYLNLCNATIVGLVDGTMTHSDARTFLHAARTGDYLRRRALDYARLHVEHEPKGEDEQ
jgi:hypothetical protein